MTAPPRYHGGGAAPARKRRDVILTAPLAKSAAASSPVIGFSGSIRAQKWHDPCAIEAAGGTAMKTLRYILAMGFILGCLCSLDVPSEARSRAIVTTSGGGVLTGELVIVNAAQNRFRLVGHSGTFTAPPGTPVEAFDGKPVEVELSRHGRVLPISE